MAINKYKTESETVWGLLTKYLCQLFSLLLQMLSSTRNSHFNRIWSVTASILHCDHDYQTCRWKKKPSLRQLSKIWPRLTWMSPFCVSLAEGWNQTVLHICLTESLLHRLIWGHCELIIVTSPQNSKSTCYWGNDQLQMLLTWGVLKVHLHSRVLEQRTRKTVNILDLLFLVACLKRDIRIIINAPGFR